MASNGDEYKVWSFIAAPGRYSHIVNAITKLAYRVTCIV